MLWFGGVERVEDVRAWPANQPQVNRMEAQKVMTGDAYSEGNGSALHSAQQWRLRLAAPNLVAPIIRIIGAFILKNRKFWPSVGIMRTGPRVWAACASWLAGPRAVKHSILTGTSPGSTRKGIPRQDLVPA
jgi:hypothetical protein